MTAQATTDLIRPAPEGRRPTAGDTLYYPGLVPVPFSGLAEFLSTDPHARDLLPIADRVLGRSLLEAGREADIYDWEIFEIAHVVMGIALTRHAVHRYGIHPVAGGGQSFGAITAAIVAGSLDLVDGLDLIRASTAVEVDHFESLAEPVGTLFFYRLHLDQVVDLMERSGLDLELSVHLDNLVHGVCGTVDDLDRFAGDVRRAGGHVFYRMNRSEHCRSLLPLRDRLAREVYGPTHWSDPRFPLVSDVDGSPLRTGSAIRDDLLDGWVTPVHWATVADGLAEVGARRIFVVGPASMFTRLVGRRAETVEVSPRSLGRSARAGAR